MDLRRQYQTIKGEIDKAIKGVLERGYFILGENVKAFEEEFAAYCGVRYGVGVASGTDALMLALRACGIGHGDEVITVANTAFPTVAAVSLTGARPVFVDVDDTYTMDVSQVEERITPRTKALLPVHLYGQPADMAPLMEIALRHHLFVIEDACQAHGAEYQGRKAGSIGHIGCFSFYPTKNLGCYGDGGMVVTSDEELAWRVVLLRNYGQTSRYHHILVGTNSRLDELQAAILRVKLRWLDWWNEKRRQNAHLYSRLLKGVVVPVERAGSRHIYHQYVIRAPRREELRHWLERNGVMTDVHYPNPIHLTEAYADLGLGRGSLPNTERFAQEIVSLPIHPELTEEEIHRVATLINRFFEETLG
jgi:dTDP-4-amino-4,6-dideoxygalactose transaminase